MTLHAIRIVPFILATLLAFSAHAAQGKLGFTVDAKFDRKVLDADIKQVVNEHSLELSGLIEKPDPKDAPMHDGKVFASTAGYVFTPEMMDYVDALEPDKSGELVLANAINAYAKDHQGGVYGRIIEGRWHDAGNKEKYLEAIVDVALDDPNLSENFRRYLEDKLKSD